MQKGQTIAQDEKCPFVVIIGWDNNPTSLSSSNSRSIINFISSLSFALPCQLQSCMARFAGKAKRDMVSGMMWSLAGTYFTLTSNFDNVSCPTPTTCRARGGVDKFFGPTFKGFITG